MPRKKQRSKGELSLDWPLLLIICLACVTFLTNLGSGFLWQDEAQTALIAKTVLTHGLPMGTDGRNSFSQEMGAEFDVDGVYKWHPWFPFYLLAAFFGLFGTSTLVARLPFALCGIATVAALYHLTRALWDSRRAGLVAALSLAVSVPFLIMAREARYYAPTALFTVVAVYAYLCLLKEKRYSAVSFAASMTLLFHTNVIQSLAVIVAIVLHALICARNRLLFLAFASAVAAILSVPWLVYSDNVSRVTGVTSEAAGHAGTATAYLGQIAGHGFPVFVLVLGIALAIWRKAVRKQVMDAARWQNMLLVGLLVCCTFVLISLTSPYPFFRYLVALLPLFCALVALVVEWAAELTHITVGIALVMLFAWVVGPVPDFMFELTHRYEGPVEGIVRYLNKHGSPDDTVVITFEDLPLKFYTQMRIYGGLAGDDLRRAEHADWIIPRKHVISDKDYQVHVWIQDTLSQSDREVVMIDSPDIPFQNRESPWEHLYRTAPLEDRVVIFRRRR